VEVPLNLICRFFSCEDILKMGVIALQAKRSLHTRVRPIILSKSKVSPSVQAPQSKAATTPTTGETLDEIVALSYCEFEELFLRCAFCAWDASYDAVSDMPTSGLGANNSEPGQKPMQLYQEECAATRNWATSAKRDSSTGRTQWGMDFVRPYTTVLARSVNRRDGAEGMSDGISGRASGGIGEGRGDGTGLEAELMIQTTSKAHEPAAQTSQSGTLILQRVDSNDSGGGSLSYSPSVRRSFSNDSGDGLGKMKPMVLLTTPSASNFPPISEYNRSTDDFDSDATAQAIRLIKNKIISGSPLPMSLAFE
jgi:hypothetical protein